MSLEPDTSYALFGGLKSNSSCSQDDTSFKSVILTLTIPLWTFITLNLLIFIIHYLRSLQYFKLYDKCTKKNAHFRYDFQLVVGKYSLNYNCTESHIIIDLLDNQLISVMTIQVPGSTIFNDNSVFMYSHSRHNMRSVSFTIYRKHPIKDVKSIRIAHSCNNPESRLMIHGANCYDATNGENKFFPITSIVKYRGTQWALNTTFEAKSDTSFSKFGCGIHDPFGITIWPTYFELVYFIFFIWCSVFFFGYLIPVTNFNSIPLHALVVSAISVGLLVISSVVHFRLIKHHIMDQHYEPGPWFLMKIVSMITLLLTSLIFWSISLLQMSECNDLSKDWMQSTLLSSFLLSMVVIAVYLVLRWTKKASDQASLDECESLLMKTNSIANMQFVSEETKGPSTQPLNATRKSASKSLNIPLKMIPRAKSGSKKSNNIKKNKVIDKKQNKANNFIDDLDNPSLNSETTYMKTKNRNSISQYV